MVYMGWLYKGWLICQNRSCSVTQEVRVSKSRSQRRVNNDPVSRVGSLTLTLRNRGKLTGTPFSSINNLTESQHQSSGGFGRVRESARERPIDRESKRERRREERDKREIAIRTPLLYVQDCSLGTLPW